MIESSTAVPSGVILFRMRVKGGLRRIFTTPAYLAFTVLWLAAAAYLAFTPSRQYLYIAVVSCVLVAVHAMLTAKFVPQTTAKHDQQVPARSRGRLSLQLAMLMAVAVLTGIGGLEFHHAVRDIAIPGWTPLMAELRIWGVLHLPDPNFLLNPMKYVVIPATLLLVLGARWRELGFARGHYTWRVVLLWSFEYILAIAVALLVGRVTPLRQIRILGSNALSNGFMEEFLWRGALQTRLSRLLNASWGLVLSALGFGVWHLGLTYTWAQGDWSEAIAIAIVVQGMSGLIFGCLFRRTGNLLAPSVVHILGNSVPW